MRLTHLTIDHFRSYPSLDVRWSDDQTHVLIGANGSGKTNILEAIHLLSTGTSFLGMEADNLPTFGSTYFRVRGTFVTDDSEERTAEVAWQREPRRAKAFFLNDVRVPSARFVGAIPTVPFLPSDLDLFTGSPAQRRTFFDRMLILASPGAAAAHGNYDATLKQRNALLRRVADGEARPQDLAVWDERLAAYGANVRASRLALLDALQAMLPTIVASLAEHPTTLALAYITKGEAREEAAMRDEFLGHLQHYRERDIIVGSTTVGPHRDDIDLIVDGHSVGLSASRGQQRTYLLGLLFGHVRLLSASRHEQPIILLDDVFSELDPHHADALMQSLDACQVFLTTTHLPERYRATVYQVSGQRVERVAAHAAVER